MNPDACSAAVESIDWTLAATFWALVAIGVKLWWPLVSELLGVLVAFCGRLRRAVSPIRRWGP